jgi:hypothetical protein
MEFPFLFALFIGLHYLEAYRKKKRLAKEKVKKDKLRALRREKKAHGHMYEEILLKNVQDEAHAME